MNKLSESRHNAAVVFILFLFLCIPVTAGELTSAHAQVQRETIVADAKKYIGFPYADGAVGPDSFDCSGFIYFIAHDAVNVQLPRTAKAMYSFVKVIPDTSLEPGDLVFFKTTEAGTVSHVGLYIGKRQFIHAASDGPNNGVIASSLNESYWKAHYAGAGKFLEPGDSSYSFDKDKEDNSADSSLIEPAAEKRSAGEGRSAESGASGGISFSDSLMCNFSLSPDWSLFTTNQFVPNYRGLNVQADVTVTKWPLNPGAGIMMRWNYGVHTFQIPVVFTLSFTDFMRIYAGPVITIGSPSLPATETEIKSSFFPGIAGISFCLPSFTHGKVQVRIIQDLCYTVFNDTDGAALSFSESVTAGLVLSTGVRVTFPLSMFTK
ncbi:MAG: C40 family peptidase [Treponema sp.]|nr:C40 family peptidase [Treponema sp.]